MNYKWQCGRCGKYNTIAGDDCVHCETMLNLLQRIRYHQRELTKARQSFGAALRYEREKCSLSQKDFAERCEYDATYISKIENGEALPGLTFAERAWRVIADSYRQDKKETEV